MNKFLQSKFFSLLTIVATIFTIFGVNMSQSFEKPYQSWIVFGLLCFLILFLIFRIYLVTRDTMRKQYNNGYLTVASFFRYSSFDGKHAIYEQFRHIQVKAFCKGSFEHRFIWTGTNAPKIESDLQKVGRIKHGEDDFGDCYHNTSLTPTRSLIYNECEILHTKAIVENDDAKPFLAQIVKEPIKLINFKVELFHAKQDNYNCIAKITRKPADKPNAKSEDIATVTFDFVTKSFTYTIISPEAGYIYKIEWEKPYVDAK